MKTKSLKKYLETRLSKEEILEIEKQAILEKNIRKTPRRYSNSCRQIYEKK